MWRYTRRGRITEEDVTMQSLKWDAAWMVCTSSVNSMKCGWEPPPDHHRHHSLKPFRDGDPQVVMLSAVQVGEEVRKGKERLSCCSLSSLSSLSTLSARLLRARQPWLDPCHVLWVLVNGTRGLADTCSITTAYSLTEDFHWRALFHTCMTVRGWGQYFATDPRVCPSPLQPFDKTACQGCW